MSRPSGLSVGIARKITLSRMRRASSVSLVATHQASSGMCCELAISLECMPPSIQTMALPSFASARASASLVPRAVARRRATSR